MTYQDIEDYRYEENTGIYRLSAIFDNYYDRKFIEMDEEEQTAKMNIMASDLNRLPLPPERLFFFKDGIMADWHFREHVIIKSPEDMEILLNNFMKYINQITFSTGKLNLGIIGDDPYKEDLRISTYREVFGVRNCFASVSIDINDIPALKEGYSIVDCR